MPIDDIITRPDKTGDPAADPRRRPVHDFRRDEQVVTVCHPVWQLGCGGLERQLLQTIGRLPRGAFRHVLVVRGWADAVVADARGLGDFVEIVRQPDRGKDRLFPVRLASVLRERSVDVLHVRGLRLLPDSFLAARLCGGVSVAFSFHGFETAGRRFGPLRRRVYRAGVSRCDDRWSVSRAAAEAIARELRMRTDAFDVLPNGVDTPRFVPAPDRSAVRRRLGLPCDRTIILCVGNLKPVKGHDTLLRAMQLLRGGLHDATLVLVGEDYLDGALQRQAGQDLPDADIRFVGQQAEPLPWYQAADLFVLPSRWEGMSNALLEAMSCGLPVVATAVGGNKEMIVHGRTGILAEAGRPEELGRAIRHLMTDPESRSALGAQGRAYVRGRYDVQISVTRHAERYMQLARRGRGRRADGRGSGVPGGRQE